MRQFMQSIPDELLEAGTIDGANEWQLFWRIVLPLSRPAIGAIAIFAFMAGMERLPLAACIEYERRVDDIASGCC